VHKKTHSFYNGGVLASTSQNPPRAVEPMEEEDEEEEEEGVLAYAVTVP